MKPKLILIIAAFLITGFCAILSYPLGIPFWKGLIVSVLSGLFTMGVVVFVDWLAKILSDKDVK